MSLFQYREFERKGPSLLYVNGTGLCEKSIIQSGVGWLCFTSHRQRGHLEMAPPFTVRCEGREARLLHRTHRELNSEPSRGSPLHYRCATQAPIQSGVCLNRDHFWKYSHSISKHNVHITEVHRWTSKCFKVCIVEDVVLVCNCLLRPGAPTSTRRIDISKYTHTNQLGAASRVNAMHVSAFYIRYSSVRALLLYALILTRPVHFESLYEFQAYKICYAVYPEYPLMYYEFYICRLPKPVAYRRIKINFNILYMFSFYISYCIVIALMLMHLL